MLDTDPLGTYGQLARATPAHNPPPKSEALVAAEVALAKAQAMPWGPERLKALQEAGLLRNAGPRPGGWVCASVPRPHPLAPQVVSQLIR